MSTKPNSLPLSGLSVLVTRPARQAEKLNSLLRSSGGTPVLWPTLTITAPDDLGPAIDVVDRLTDYDVAVFVSTNAVEHGMELIRAQSQTLDHLKVVAVGEATAERLRREGLDPIAPSTEAGTEGLLAFPVFWTPAINGKKVVIFRGFGGRELMRETLLARGAQVDYAEVYERVKPDADRTLLADLLHKGKLDIVLATSAAGLQNLDELAGADLVSLLHRLPIVVMSERMAAMATELGYNEARLVVSDASDEGIVAKLEEWCESMPRATARAARSSPEDTTTVEDTSTAANPFSSSDPDLAPTYGAEAVSSAKPKQPAQDTLLRASEPMLTQAQETLAGLATEIKAGESESTMTDDARGAADTAAEHRDPPSAAAERPADVVALDIDADHCVDDGVLAAADFSDTRPFEPEPATLAPSVTTTASNTDAGNSSYEVPMASATAAAPARPGWINWLALALGGSALALQLFWTQTVYSPAANSTASRLDSLQGAVETLRTKLPEGDQLRGELKSLAEKETSELQNVTGAIEHLREDDKAIQSALEALDKRTPQNREDWVLAEVDYLLLAADERLHNGYDVKAALAALQTADDRLNSLSRPNLSPVREQLTKDMNDVRAMEVPDVTGHALYLADLLERVEQLPMKGGDVAEHPRPELPQPNTAATVEREKSISGLASAIWQDLTSLVKIEETNLKDSSTFQPEFRYFLQQHLRLEIAGARLDLVRRSPVDLKASAGVIKNLLTRFYDTDAEAVKSVLSRLDEITALELQPRIPDISGSLQMVRKYAEPGPSTRTQAATEVDKAEPAQNNERPDTAAAKGNAP